MGLFNRRSTAKESASLDWAPVETEPQGQKYGPFDRSQVDERGPRVDLGAIWLPVVAGLELRMEVDKKSQKVTGVTAALEGSNLQIQAFAAPRTDGIWDEIRHEIALSVRGQGGVVDDVPGVFGRELLVRMPATGPNGQAGQRPARFIGVDGPRWFIRGVLAGKAALDTEAAKPLESVFANIVVLRDQSPRPPRDLLPLVLPQQTSTDASSEAEQAEPEGAAPQMADFNPLRRGPEITQIG